MVNDLKLWAVERGAEAVVIPFVPTSRNRPALNFLSSYCSAPTDATEPFDCFLSASGSSFEWRPTAAVAMSLEPISKSTATAGQSIDEADLLTRIATHLRTSGEILNAVRGRKFPRPAVLEDYIEPREELEKALAAIWSDCLSVEPVGVRDNFIDLGGTSLIAARILARVYSELGFRLGLAEAYQHPDVQRMAAYLSTIMVQAPGATAALPTRASVSPTGST